MYQIVCWSDPEIEMETGCRRKEKIIQSSVEHMLLEAFRLEDERKQEVSEAGNHAAQGDASGAEPETTQSLTDEPSNAQSAALKELSLGAYLQQTEGVKSFAIFDDQGFLQEQHPDAGELAKLAPTIFLTAALQAGVRIEQQFSFLEFRDMNNQRCILCQSGKTSVALQLNPGCHPPTLTAQLALLDSRSTA